MSVLSSANSLIFLSSSPADKQQSVSRVFSNTCGYIQSLKHMETDKLFLSFSKKMSVDNRVQICARFIVQEAANMHKRTSECAKLLLSITLLE